MRLLLSILLATAAFAQAPSDKLVTKLAERDTPQKRFLRDNPGATEFLRNENTTHFRKADGTFGALVSPGLNYVDADNQIQPVAPEMWQTDAGFRQTGTPVPIRLVTTSPNQDTIELWNGTRVATATTSKLTKTGDFTWTFPWSQITWTLEVLPGGWQVTSQPIAAARGVRNYQMPLASTGLNLVPDAGGNLVDGTFTITRAVMVRADRVVTPCSAWTATAKAAGFTCDDSAFPPAAFPYIIDPTVSSYINSGGGGSWRQDGSYSDEPGSGSCSLSWGSPVTTRPVPYYNFGTTMNDGWEWMGAILMDFMYSCSESKSRPYMRFDTSSVPSAPTSASLNLYVTGWYDDGHGHDMHFFYSSSTTYTDYPLTIAAATGAIHGRTAYQWNAMPLTINAGFKYGAGALTVLAGYTPDWVDDPGTPCPPPPDNPNMGTNVSGGDGIRLNYDGETAASGRYPYLSVTYANPAKPKVIVVTSN